ncbi:hypothetical protein Niako_3264 [Niastella koreensis GR20-10]|uniref:Uncharacterized protein n=1 Tax=Niastella koreensis (strain DSM 17620 / KACC 11465 / NBRC 106392 / GR20-10) TaxID=700598 RepID=G8TGY8_NIAKG|nr:hypothetical protein Niako_3264 [Niastella koreensis GR20-10]
MTIQIFSDITSLAFAFIFVSFELNDLIEHKGSIGKKGLVGQK